jgi:hypothetical protein
VGYFVGGRKVSSMCKGKNCKCENTTFYLFDFNCGEYEEFSTKEEALETVNASIEDEEDLCQYRIIEGVMHHMELLVKATFK